METAFPSVQTIPTAASNLGLYGTRQDLSVQVIQETTAASKFDLCGKLKDPRILPYLRFIAHYMSLPAPIAVDLDTSSICNFKCPSCVDQISLNRGMIPTERLRSLVVELAESGIRAVNFVGGGEPTTHPAMPECIEWASYRGLVTSLVTNGSLLNRNLAVYAESVSSWLRVSIDAATAKTHAIVHGVGDTWFPIIIRSVESLARVKRFHLGYSFIVFPSGSQANYFELAAAARLAKEIGCDYFEAKVAVDPATKRILPTTPEVTKVIAEQLVLANELNDSTFQTAAPASFFKLIKDQVQHQEKDYPHCLAQEIRTTITPSGLYVCTYHRGEKAWRYGSLDEGSFQTLWRGKPRQALKDRLIPSLHCTHFCCRHEQNKYLYYLRETASTGAGRFEIASPCRLDDIWFP